MNRFFDTRLLRDLSRPFGSVDPAALRASLYPGQLGPYVSVANVAGVSFQRAFDAARIRGHPDDPSLTVTSGQFGRFLEALTSSFGRELPMFAFDFGIESSQPLRFRQAVSRAGSPLSALAAIRALAHLVSPTIQIELHLTPSHLYVAHLAGAKADAPGTSVSEVFRTLAIVTLLERFLGDDWRPEAIGLTCRPVDSRGLEMWLQGGEIVSGLPVCAIPIRLNRLRRARVVTSDGSAAPPDGTARAMGSHQAGPGDEDPPLDLLQATLPSLLRSGAPGIEEAARSVGMSVRTLQRRLRERGVSYRSVVEGVRMGEARRLLEEGGDLLHVIARRLGYREVSSFSRAFRRRYGLAPSQFQDASVGAPGGD